MHYDHVLCNNCGKKSLVPCGSDICIKCGIEGCLSFVDDEKPERTAESFRNSVNLLKGKFWQEAQENADTPPQRGRQ